MATQAKCRIVSLAVTSVAVFLRKMLMTDRPQQRLTLPTMRIVTGETIDPSKLATEMNLLKLGTSLMTGETQITPATFDQPVVIAGMGGMAGTAVALFKRLVAELEIADRCFVAAITEFTAALNQQSTLGGDMRGMTLIAFPLLDRQMQKSFLRHLIGNSLMTGITELRFSLPQQHLMFGDMRAVTGSTLLFGNRLMNDRAGKLALIVARETISGACGKR